MSAHQRKLLELLASPESFNIRSDQQDAIRAALAEVIGAESEEP